MFILNIHTLNAIAFILFQIKTFAKNIDEIFNVLRRGEVYIRKYLSCRI